MNLLLVSEIAPASYLPDFGPAFRAHMAKKANPKVYEASLAAWGLLSKGFERMGLHLPEITFEAGGKPTISDFGLQISDLSLFKSNFGLYFDDKANILSNFSLYFSLSHSESIAAALISTHPCGVDVEMVRSEVSDRLYDRCMHPAELALGMDFFQAWTRKECIAKLDGSGMPGHPDHINSADAQYSNWHTQLLQDENGRSYVLSALCMNAEPVRYEYIKRENL